MHYCCNVLTFVNFVAYGIPQGTILGPRFLIIYINDLPDICKQKVYLFAADAKLYKHVHVFNVEDHQSLESGLNAMQTWSDKWLLKLNKCKTAFMA